VSIAGEGYTAPHSGFRRGGLGGEAEVARAQERTCQSHAERGAAAHGLDIGAVVAGAPHAIEIEPGVGQALGDRLKASSRWITLQQTRENGVRCLVADALRHGAQDELHREGVVDGALGWPAWHVLIFDLVVKASQAVERRGAEELGGGAHDDLVMAKERFDLFRQLRFPRLRAATMVAQHGVDGPAREERLQ
jgi:hypothetical protein